MKKTHTATLLLLALLAVAIVGILSPQAASVDAAPFRSPYEIEPAYDSGWFLMDDGWGILYHGQGWRPISMTVLVADTEYGWGATEAIPNPDPWCYGGYLEAGATCDWFWFYWGQHVGYSQETGAWYNGGQHYARVLVWTTSHSPPDPPCRP